MSEHRPELDERTRALAETAGVRKIAEQVIRTWHTMGAGASYDDMSFILAALEAALESEEDKEEMIAAAPEMYELLRLWMDDGRPFRTGGAYDQTEVLLARIDGETEGSG